MIESKPLRLMHVAEEKGLIVECVSSHTDWLTIYKEERKNGWKSRMGRETEYYLNGLQYACRRMRLSRVNGCIQIIWIILLSVARAAMVSQRLFQSFISRNRSQDWKSRTLRSFEFNTWRFFFDLFDFLISEFCSSESPDRESRRMNQSDWFRHCNVYRLDKPKARLGDFSEYFSHATKHQMPPRLCGGVLPNSLEFQELLLCPRRLLSTSFPCLNLRIMCKVKTGSRTLG